MRQERVFFGFLSVAHQSDVISKEPKDGEEHQCAVEDQPRRHLRAHEQRAARRSRYRRRAWRGQRQHSTLAISNFGFFSVLGIKPRIDVALQKMKGRSVGFVACVPIRAWAMIERAALTATYPCVV